MNKNDRTYIMRPKNDTKYNESLVYRDDPDWRKYFIKRNDYEMKTHCRIMTYNIHGFRDREVRDTKDEILDVIRESNADVIVFEEFTLILNKSLIQFEEFASILKTFGYLHIHADPLYRNVMASRFEAKFESIDIGSDPIKGENRHAIFAHMVFDNPMNYLNTIIVGTHLDVYDETCQTRVAQMQKILNKIDEINTINKSNKTDTNIERVIVTGDFNCLRPDDYTDREWNQIVELDKECNVDTHLRSKKYQSNQSNQSDQITRKIDAVDLLEDASYVDASVQINASDPIKSSVWSNRRIDYVFGLNVEFKRANVIKTACSDHHPIYADFIL